MLPNRLGYVIKINVLLQRMRKAGNLFSSPTPSFSALLAEASNVTNGNPNYSPINGYYNMGYSSPASLNYSPSNDYPPSPAGSSSSSISFCPNSPSTSHQISPSSGRIYPMPEYSTEVKAALLSGSYGPYFDLLIEETAHHLLRHGDMTNKTDYANFGTRLVETYPCLKHHGHKPYVK